MAETTIMTRASVSVELFLYERTHVYEDRSLPVHDEAIAFQHNICNAHTVTVVKFGKMMKHLLDCNAYPMKITGVLR